MYENGDKVTKDDIEAARWYRKAADQGHVAGQTGLAKMYIKSKNDAEAIHWLRKAADQEYTAAQYGLGLAYAAGRGVDKDDGEAVRWFRRAAERGHPYAEQELRKRESNRKASAKQVDLEQSVKSFGIVAGLYATPSRLSDECSTRYPSLSRLARTTKDAYVARNKALFEQTAKRINLLIENHRDEKEKAAAQMMLIVMKPIFDQKMIEAIQPMLSSDQTCEAALEKIGGKGMDLESMAADQLAAINQ